MDILALIMLPSKTITHTISITVSGQNFALVDISKY